MKKFLSLVLALTLVASLFTVNVMADSTAHTVTVTADKTTGLKAGDKVTVEVKVDDTLNISALQYTLVYDTEAFQVDKTKVPPLPTGTPNCYDNAWFSGIKTSPNWSMFMTTSANNCDVDGQIYFGWSGAYGIMAGYNDKDFVIGKFYLTVKDDVVDGTYSIGLSTATEGEYNVPVCHTKSEGEAEVAGMISTPVTVTVGSGAPTPATPSVNTEFGTATDAGIAANRDGVSFVYDNAYAVTVKMTDADKATKAGIQFIPAKVLAANGGSWDDAAAVEFAADGLGAGERDYTAALINIPRKFAEKPINMLARGFVVVDGKTITGKEVEKEITYRVTPEPGQN